MVAEYRERPLRWRDLFLLFLPAAAAALTPLLYGLQRYYYGQAYYGPAAAQAWSRPWFQLAALALVPLLLLGWRRVRQAHRLVRLHKHGLHIRRPGKQPLNLPWHAIQALACEQTSGALLGKTLTQRTRLTLFPRTGDPVELDSRIKGLDDLAARLKAHLYPRWLPELRAALRRGEWLSFGEVRLNRLGIQVRDAYLPWEQATLITVENGMLKMRTAPGDEIKLRAGKIPNLELFIQLLREEVAA
ncbi:MAG: hypothetical protein D6803_04080 [Anaerolineae bacterium]|nr:MAG: hypothetical protein D6803_04080 [Anaerolineae bacterium]